MGKYDHLLFELFPEETHWGSWCAKPQGYFRGENSMPGATYHVGFQTIVKSVNIGVPHFHAGAEEYLVFLGANVPDVFDFDATIELDIGEDPDNMETMVIDKATVVRIPQNIWHGPLRFNVRKPVVFQAAYFDGYWSSVYREPKGDGTYKYVYDGDDVRMCVKDSSVKCTFCGACFDKLNETGYNEADYANNVTAKSGEYKKTSYEHLKYELPEMITYWGDWVMKPQAYMHGDHDFPGSNYHVGFQVFQKSSNMEVPHYHHHADEYLVFLGPHYPDIFDWDADIQIFVGEDPDNMEKIEINKPSILRIPRGMWHCPLYFDIRKPIMFQATYLNGTWSKVLRRKKEDGTYEYYYEGDNLRKCRLEPEKWCNICGKCFTGFNETSYSEKAQSKPNWEK